MSYVDPDHNVLHIDDDPAFTRLIKETLAHRGIATTPLHDPALAIDQLLCVGHRVVLLDIDMPGVNGLEVLEKIKQHDGGVGVIILTGIVSTASVLRSLRKGAAACLFKPVTDLAPLEAAIRAEFMRLERWKETIRELQRLRSDENEVLASLERMAN